MGLTLLAQAELSMEFWAYAFTCVVHLINRLPTPVLDASQVRVSISTVHIFRLQLLSQRVSMSFA
ncbi:hypothetical protein V6Z11_D05G319900 [Gossypium hirsutum]